MVRRIECTTGELNSGVTSHRKCSNVLEDLRYPHHFTTVGYKEMSPILADQGALVYDEPNCGGGGKWGFSANEYSFANGAQKNFGDLTP